MRKLEQKLKFIQRKQSKKKKTSKNRQKLRLKLAKTHEKIRNQRIDFLHKISRILANNYNKIAIEKLNIKNMIKNHYLAKSINDASWHKFIQFLSYKVEETGGQMIQINANGTSQHCICGNKVKKKLSTRIHKCNKCGLKIDRDTMSAIIIKAIAFDNYTVGTTGINACGDALLEASKKQEAAPFRVQ